LVSIFKKETPVMKKAEPVRTIPIMLDSIKKMEDFDMSRCTYFTIETDVPSPDWRLGTEGLEIPSYLLGVYAIIYKPLGANETFDTAESIDDLFDAIEDRPDLYVDTNDIWLPNDLFEGLPHKRGHVYRADPELFKQAYAYRQDRISKNQFTEFCRGRKGAVKFSEVETEAFRGWEARQIEAARKHYHEHPERGLKYRA
jgi:hypothetical protein